MDRKSTSIQPLPTLNQLSRRITPPRHMQPLSGASLATTTLHRGCTSCFSHFHKLTRELREMILDELLTDGTNDVQLRRIGDHNITSAAIEELEKLKMVDKEMHIEATNYMYLRHRFVFVDEEQPCRVLLRTFNRQTSLANRQLIRRIYIPQFTIQGLIYNSETPMRSLCLRSRFDLDSARSSYLQSKYPKSPIPYDFRSDASVFSSLHQDMQLTMQLLRFTFPSLKRLDLGLDILECLPYRGDDSYLGSSSLSHAVAYARKGAWKWSYMMDRLCELKTFPGIRQMSVQIFWKDFIERRAVLDIQMTDELRKELQHLFLAQLREQIPAVKITGQSVS
jgi:hypothetical protein